MARMPTRDNLPQALPTANKQIVSAPTNRIGEAVSALGVSVARAAKADKEKQSSMELARARSQFQTNMLQGDKAYNLKDKPDHKTWGDEADKGVKSWQKSAMDGISDPEIRERFKLETDDDAVRFTIGVGNRAQEIANKDQLATTEQALDQMAVNAADPDLSEEDRAGLRQDLAESLKGLVRSGIITPAQADVKAKEYRKRIAKLRVMTDIQNDPIAARNAMNGGDGDTINLIKQREAFISVPKWDKTAYRAGYGSDTYTTADGKVHAVKKGVRVSRADAERDIVRRTKEFQETITKQVTKKVFSTLPGNVRAAITSFAYNYGSLTPSVAKAVKTGDVEKIAKAIEDRAGDNDGINYERRMQEAAIVRGETDSIKSQSYYNDLSAEDRISLGAAADAGAESEEKEFDKNDAIDEARTLADYAKDQFADRNEAARYIKNNASDPAIREDALKALDAEFRRSDAAEQKAKVEQYDKTFTKVQEFIEADDPDAARKAIPENMDGEDRRKLLKLINQGPATVDDSKVLGELQAMRLHDPASFAEVDLRKYQTDLTVDRIDQLHAFQQALKKDTTKYTTLQSADRMLQDEMGTMGIVTGAKASPADIRYAQRIRAMVAPEIENRERAKGKPLSTRELQEVIDDTFVSFRDDRPSGWGWSAEKEITVVDVFKEFNEYEDDNDLSTGSLMDKAMREARQANPDRTPTAEQLAKWLYDFKNRKQLQ